MKLKKLAAAFSAAAVSLLGLAVIPAFAAEPAPGDVDTTKTGSITVHKYANPGIDPAAKADGTDVNTKFAASTPIENVKFKVTKLTSDLKTMAGWEEVKNLNNGLKTNPQTAVPQDKKTTTASEQSTNNAGIAIFDNLTVGAYLVEEIDASQAKPKVNTNGMQKPFIVTIPYNNGDAGWLYGVHVFPKNDVETGKAEKTIDTTVSSDYMKNAVVPWKITLPVNALEAGKTRTHFGAWDAVASYLTFKDVTNAKFIAANGNETDVTVNCTKENSKWETAGFDHNLYKCLVDNANINLLKTGGKVIFTLNSTLTEDLPTTKAAIDQAFKLIDQSKEKNGPDNPPVPPVTPPDEQEKPKETPFYGDLSFKKVDSKAADLTLGGAKFKLTKLGADGMCTTPGADLTGATAESVKGTGAVTFNNVFVKLAAPSTEVTTLNESYCLVETEAPAGYAKAANTKVTITAGTTATAGGLADGNFKNEKDTSLIPNLPLTGAAGSVILTLAGIALLAVAVGFGIRTARKNG